MSKKAQHFIVLDSWRGICACMVALLHVMVNSHLYPLPFIRAAGFFVDFFFVLSGFVIFANYEDRLKKGYSVIKFMFLRFGRLYPLHISILLVFIASEVVQGFLPGISDYTQYAPFSAPGETLSDIISQIFLFHALDTETHKAFNSPSWSISAEFYTYLTFALALVFFKNRIGIFCAALAILAISLLSLIFSAFPQYYFIEGFLRCLAGFAAGGICWHIHTKQALQNHALSINVWSFIEVAIILAIYLFIVFSKGTVYRYLAPVVFSFTILIFAFEKGFISKLLSKRFFVFLGMLSYSIYMVHAFIASKVLPLSAWLIEKTAHLKLTINIDGKEMLGTSLWQGDIITLVYMVLVVATSYITFKLIEAPGRKLSRHLVEARRRKLTSALTSSS